MSWLLTIHLEKGFDWETAPWFDANGLSDIAPMQDKNSTRKTTR